MKTHNTSIVVVWNRLPTYAAHLIAAGRKVEGYDFPVIETKPNVPDKVGAAHDLSINTNTFRFNNLSPNGILKALLEVPQFKSSDYLAMESASLKAAKKFGPKTRADSLLKIVEESQS